MLMHLQAQWVAPSPTTKCVCASSNQAPHPEQYQSAHVSNSERTELMLANAMGTSTVLLARDDIKSPALVCSGELGAKYDVSICPRPRKLCRPDARTQSPHVCAETDNALQIERQGLTRSHAAILLSLHVA